MPADDPCEIDKLCRADRLRHLRRDEKNAAADDGADDNGSGGCADSEVAGELGRGGRWHGWWRVYRVECVVRWDKRALWACRLRAVAVHAGFLAALVSARGLRDDAFLQLKVRFGAKGAANFQLRAARVLAT